MEIDSTWNHSLAINLSNKNEILYVMEVRISATDLVFSIPGAIRNGHLMVKRARRMRRDYLAMSVTS
jgi:hypothetical protein